MLIFTKGYLDPRGRPKFTAGSVLYFGTWCLYVCPHFAKYRKTNLNNFQVKIAIVISGTVGPAECTIDGRHVLLKFNLISLFRCDSHPLQSD